MGSEPARAVGVAIGRDLAEALLDRELAMYAAGCRPTGESGPAVRAWSGVLVAAMRVAPEHVLACGAEYEGLRLEIEEGERR